MPAWLKSWTYGVHVDVATCSTKSDTLFAVEVLHAVPEQCCDRWSM